MNSSALDKIRQAFDSDDAPTKNLALRLAFDAIDAMQEKCGRLENLNNSLALVLEDERDRIEALTAENKWLRWALNDAVKTSVENARQRDAARTFDLQKSAEIERLRGVLLWIRGVCAEELDLEYTDAMRRKFQRNVRDAALKALTDPEAGQPWLRTYDAHLKGTNNAE